MMAEEPLLPGVLLVLGLGLFFLEAIIPSMGVITVAGIIAVVSAVALGFRISPVWGLVFSVIAALSVPLAVVFFFYVARRTRIVHSSDEADYKASGRADAGLVGREGVAISYLRPTGIANIDGQRLDVVADGAFIEAGSRIKIVRVDGIKVVVREVVN